MHSTSKLDLVQTGSSLLRRDNGHFVLGVVHANGFGGAVVVGQDAIHIVLEPAA